MLGGTDSRSVIWDPVLGRGEAGQRSSDALLQKMRLLPSPEIIRQKSHGCREQKRRAMMGRFLAWLLRHTRACPGTRRVRATEENWLGIK